eukprot:m51a1_g10041 hypothetical protein (783) ;mRNA; r:21279-23802
MATMGREYSTGTTFTVEKRASVYTVSTANPDQRSRSRRRACGRACGSITRRLQVSVGVAIVALVCLCVVMSAVPQIAIWWTTAKSSTDIATSFLLRSVKNLSTGVFAEMCIDAEKVLNQLELAAQRTPAFCEGAPLLDSWREPLDAMLAKGREFQLAGYADTRGYHATVYGTAPQPYYLSKPVLWAQDPRGSPGRNGVYRSFYLEWNSTKEDWYVGAPTGMNSSTFDSKNRPWYIDAIGDSQMHWDGPYLSLPEGFLVMSLSMSYSIRDKPNPKCGVIFLMVALTDFSAKLQAARVRNSDVWIAGSDKNWSLIGTSTDAKTDLVVDGLVRRLPIEQSEDAVTAGIGREARRIYRDGQLGTLQRATIGGRKYLMYVDLVDVRPGTGFPPVFVIVGDPETDFSSGITRAVWITIGVAAGMVVVCAVFATLVAVLVSSSLRMVAQLMEQASELEPSDQAKHNNQSAVLTEVESINLCMHKMWTLLDSFHKYVPVEVLRILQTRGEVAKLVMSRHRCTTMFCDIENFTVLTETTDPDRLIIILTDFMDMCTKTIDESGGIVDKFIGDCIMAFWGYPGESYDMELRACQTALRIRAGLPPLHKKWAAEGLTLITCRVGLATGDVLVGNNGSSDHLHYTVLGMPVNLAARLEPMNKFFCTRILVCRDTQLAVREHMVIRSLGRAWVKGFARPQEIYELVGESESTDPVELRRTRVYNDAMAAVDQGALDDAARRIEEFVALSPQSDCVHALRIARKIEQAQHAGETFQGGAGDDSPFIFDLTGGIKGC